MSVVLNKGRVRIDLEQPLIEDRGGLIGDRHNLFQVSRMSFFCRASID